MAIKLLIEQSELIILVGLEVEFYVTSSHVVKCFLEHSTLVEHPYFCEIKREKEALQYELVTNPIPYTSKLSLFVETFKSNLKNIAFQKNEKVWFTAKPFKNLAGSSLHVNISFFNVTTKKFLMKEDPLFLFAIGGLCANLEQNMLYFAPFYSSYKRFFTECIDVPRVIGWGFNNRSVALRIPNAFPHRIEHRVAGVDCRLQKTLEVIIVSVIYGMKDKIAPEAPIYGIPDILPSEGKRLPFSYTEAAKKYKEIKIVDLLRIKW